MHLGTRAKEGGLHNDRHRNTELEQTIKSGYDIRDDGTAGV